jgi:MFS family permease
MWADRDVTRVVAARFISRIGGEAAFFVGIWGKAAFQLEATATELAAVMAALGIAALIGSAIAGVLVDRFDPRRVLIAGEILFVPVAIGMIFADTIPSMVVMTFALGLVGTPVYTAIASFAPYLTDDQNRLARINGYIEGASWAAFVVGPAVGALLTATAGLESIFVLDAATSAVAALLVVPVRVRDVAKQDREGSHGIDELKQGFRYSYKHAHLRFFLIVGSLVWILFGTFSALEPLFYRDVLGVTPVTMGWVNSLFGIGLVAGTLISARFPARFRNARAVVILVAANSVGDLLYVGTNRLPVVVAAGMTWGLVIGAMAPLLRTMIQIHSPDEMLGRITGVSQVNAEVAHLLPLAVAPWLAGIFGVQRSLILAGVVVGLMAMAFYPQARRLDAATDKVVPRPGFPDQSTEPRSVGH